MKCRECNEKNADGKCIECGEYYCEDCAMDKEYACGCSAPRTIFQNKTTSKQKETKK